MLPALVAALGPEILEQIALLAGAGMMNKFMLGPGGKPTLGSRLFMGASSLPMAFGTIDRTMGELENWGFDPVGRKSRFVRAGAVGALPGLAEDLEMGLQEGRARDIGKMATQAAYLKPGSMHDDFASGLSDRLLLENITNNNTGRLAQMAVTGPPSLQEMAAQAGITL